MRLDSNHALHGESARLRGELALTKAASTNRPWRDVVRRVFQALGYISERTRDSPRGVISAAQRHRTEGSISDTRYSPASGHTAKMPEPLIEVTRKKDDMGGYGKHT